MDTRKNFVWLAICFFGLWLSACGRTNSAPVATAPPSTTDLFSSTNVVRLNIIVDRSGMRQLGRTSWRPGGGKDRPEVKATVTEGGAVYTNVAIHLKGAAGSFRQLDDRPAFTLNFDKFAKGQRFHGLQKLSLNNSVQDPTLVNEKICREMFAAAGVPVPRSDYAVVTLNDRPLGLYVLVEGYNKQFLKRYFKDVSGNLYDGGFCQEITDNLQTNSGDKPEDRSDIERLVDAAIKTHQQNRLAELERVLDMERFLSLVAMEVIQCHWDGYAMNRNNYRLYNDRDSGRMIFMPHGLDQMFGIGDRPDLHTPLIPHMAGMVAGAAMATQEGRERYMKRLSELRTNVFVPEKIVARVRELEQRLRPVLARIGQGEVSYQRGAVEQLCRNILERAESIDEQLSTPRFELVFDEKGLAPLAGWRPRQGMTTEASRPPVEVDGRKALHLPASRENGAASWRMRIAVPQGRYRFEGLAKTVGAGKNGDGGALLRISGSQSRQALRGDTEWTPLSFAFEVHEFMQEVEFVCELKGSRGEAWFDAESLRLKQVGR